MMVSTGGNLASDRRGAPDTDWLWKAGSAMRTNSGPELTEASIAAAGLRVDERIEVGDESRRLLHAARFLRAPERYVAQFGQWAYDIMRAHCLWHVYHKLSARVHLLSIKPR